jgi:hypothetical protein
MEWSVMDEHSLFLELVESMQREAGRIMDKYGKSDETISPLLDALGDLSVSLISTIPDAAERRRVTEDFVARLYEGIAGV